MARTVPHQIIHGKAGLKQKVKDLHVAEFCLGQTIPYLSKDKTTLDIGARNGLYATFFAEHSKNVICFEAVQELCGAALKTVCEDYDNVECRNVAVSDHGGTIDFYVDDKRLSMSSVYDLVNGIKRKVISITIDSLELDDVGFMKIDVEGHELAVLRGAAETIRRNSPSLMIEIYPKWLPENEEEVIFDLLMNEWGYKCFYNHRNVGQKGTLISVKDVNHGVEMAAEENINIHDGDFLFVK